MFLIRTGTESTRWSVQREAGIQVRWQGTIIEKESKGGYLDKYLFFDWEPVKLSEKWFNMLMSASAKNDFCCIILIFLFCFVVETVHLTRSDVNEQRVVTSENERTHQLSSGFPRHEVAIKANSSVLRHTE